MYLNAESVTVDSGEGQFTLLIDSTEEDTITVNIHGIDLDAFYDQVKARIGPYLRERDEMQAKFNQLQSETPIPGVSRIEVGPYDISSTKHPRYHSTHADLYDQRDGK